MNSEHDSAMARRTFLKLGSMGLAAAAAGAGLAQEPPAAAKPDGAAPVYRMLGKTGMKVSVIGIGGLKTIEPSVFQAAFDRGVNYVDTARVYMDGKSERIVSEALQGYRDKVFVATKVMTHSDPKEKIQETIAASLEALKLDYVDLLQLHGVVDAEGVNNKEWREVFAEARKQGKARHIGLTTHANEVAVVNAVVDDPDKFWETILVTYNFKSDPKLKEAIARAGQAGIGVIAMKTQAGGYQTADMGDVKPHQAALKWVLQDTNIATTVPGMVDLKQVVEDTSVMGMMKLTAADIDALKRYEMAIAPFYCQRCGVCRGSCPAGVNIPEVNRSLMYVEGGYADLALAQATYRQIPEAASLLACGDCARCTARCPNGLHLESRLQRARELLG